MIVLAAVLFAKQSQSLLGIYGRPTGKNGYEEYVQAAEILRDSDARVYADWNPGAEPPRPPGLRSVAGYGADDKARVALYRHLNGLVPLEVRREELKHFGQALLLVRRGNGKPVFDPRSDMGPDTLFPEFANFRAITRFATRAATVYAADGQTNRAVDVLLDQLVFADNVGRSVLIASLVGAASTTTALAALGELLPRLSRTDALRIQQVVESILARPVGARSVIPAELAFTKAALRQGFAGDGKGLFDDSDDEADAKSKAMAHAFQNLTRSERMAMLGRLEARLDARALAMDRILAGPERDWAVGLAQLAGEEDENAADLESGFIALLTPVYSGLAITAVRNRTQLRLLDLHARLLQYRWDFGRYPKSLEVTDPLTEAPYIYDERSDGTLRLASRGIPQTGEIELRYRRPAPSIPVGTKP